MCNFLAGSARERNPRIARNLGDVFVLDCLSSTPLISTSRLYEHCQKFSGSCSVRVPPRMQTQKANLDAENRTSVQASPLLCVQP